MNLLDRIDSLNIRQIWHGKITYESKTTTVMDNLIGQTIDEIRLSEDNETIVFKCGAEYIGYRTDADCCSETWFADILGVDALLGATVLQIVEMPWDMFDNYNINDGRCRQVEDAVYGYKLRTNRGYADIIFRNSSNGYYGGSIFRWLLDSVERYAVWQLIDRDYPY